MRVLLCTVCLLLPIVLTGCEPAETYPVTGEECGPGDPVKTLDASDCDIPGVI